ncbi:Retrovirus-related Pol polyprotein from transposon opus [Gossypium australe]|uniref:Retrovirus-related Pol polyprotein from transposon opus n=1 Tax=Gossypium australe TaxID=47621 RepID=A0A5B6WYT7_9ROSI|nr:Retrovirus-related Pol polyprotein from transposon opus [Gossypium australe]
MEVGPNSNALCDLGTNINLIPLSIYEKLGIGELKNAKIILQLADRSLVQPKGVLEDVLVKVRKFTIPVNFVIIDFEETVKYQFCWEDRF